MEVSTQELRSRRWKGRMIRLALVGLALGIAAFWTARRLHFDRGRGRDRVRSVAGVSGVQGAVSDASLRAGDLRIYNRDSTINLVLRGPEILAGLSPMTIAKVQAEMTKSSAKDSSGIGGLIASTVKQTVANTIGTHVVYRLSEIEDLRYEDGQLIAERADGRETRLFGDTKVNGTEQGRTFDAVTAGRFIEAVRARKRELGQR